MEVLLSFLPKNISNQISKIPPNQMKEMEEIRVRVNRPLEISASGIAHVSILYSSIGRCRPSAK